ncbi:hypothetical protein GCG54_00002593 [Colletotrichum gloeosporioides]|uniref:NACHT domain-containing protein n=1 Tax=Colletotrichum gloeosporioides TaxID=474922 RepID=A0A8H4FQ19_COLGL|nr:uncharacterized protein GCG54_00002593 [Colletotrichum gloeosporioides]KAF3810141.1 hypothetical protein GCG54_00002593 [Colletotrichum gloeosporioides]
MSDPLDYSVALICAIATTFVAARAFLEETHEPPVAVARNDNNSYVLGRIGRHNVVVATLPEGEYGTTSAAGVARDTLHSFPSIRVCLMVGIGGGAPSAKHDIRLGDVVVGNRGVSKYDFRKSMQEQTFVETGFLNLPPIPLLTATSTLEATYALEGHQLDDNIKDVIKTYPRLRKTYSRPSASSDRLYKPSVSHIGSGEPCREVCGDDVSLLELRSERKEDEDNPAIHYGRIGSSNQLINDAFFRDQLASKRDLLCFEMEAADLMNHFPCLVIHGICDYADSHKNGEWHGYAAMAAAAYAKDLLCQIPSSRIETERRITDIIGKVVEISNHNKSVMSEIKVAKRSILQDIRVQAWLSPSDTSTNRLRARKVRHQGTGKWFLENTVFMEWTTGVRQHLWLHGIPGSGKTVLSTAILDHVSQIHDHVALNFFFDFSDTSKTHIDTMYRSLAFQLYQQQEASRPVVDALFAPHDNGWKQAETEKLSKCLLAMLQASGKVYIILDALDECVNQTELLEWIQGLVSNPHFHNVQLFATSRPEEELERGIRKCISEHNCISFDKNLLNENIGPYISSRLEQS